MRHPRQASRKRLWRYINKNSWFKCFQIDPNVSRKELVAWIQRYKRTGF